MGRRRRRTQPPPANPVDELPAGAGLEGVLSPELAALVGDDVQPTQSARPPKAKKPRPPSPETQRAAEKMSKRKRKKLAHLRELEAKAERRKAVIERLAANRLDAGAKALLQSTSSLGSSMTKRQRVKHSLGLERAGVALTEEQKDELYSAAGTAAGAAAGEAPVAAVAAAPAPRRALQQGWNAAEQSSSDSDSDSDSGPDDQPKPMEMGAAQRKLAELRERNAALKATREAEAAVAAEAAAKAAQVESWADGLSAETEETGDAPYIPVPLVVQTAADAGVTAAKAALNPYRVNVARPADIQAARMQLPVVGMEQEIVEAIMENDVVIVCGETGSGKTTQVPQFLYEAGFGNPAGPRPGLIGVTQPRRVAAVSTAQRVAVEMGFARGSGRDAPVAHQIRYDSAGVGPRTRIKFMTDGILLQEIQTDFLLQKYSALLLDEAHERNLNTDVLIGLLSRAVPLRKQRGLPPLKLVIMSATLRVEDFTANAALFPTPPPVVTAESRQFEVQTFFSKRTELVDYVGAAFAKVCKIHRRLPAGGILVFLTGQQEILHLCRRLHDKFGGAAPLGRKVRSSGSSGGRQVRGVVEMDDEADAADVEEATYESDGEDGQDDDDDDPDDDDDEQDSDEDAGPLLVLPLYSLLSPEAQLRVFQPPPAGHRLVVVATNVAETSVTIPGISYVVDSGRAKERAYDGASGVAQFRVGWVSKASANQRAGRAGRTGPGKAYRLYSSAVFNDQFESFAAPEVLRRPVHDVVLQMKAMGVDDVANFPFPTPPERAALRDAVRLLVQLGALQADGERATALGRVMASYPVASRFAKMLVLGAQQGCQPYVVALVAALSGQSPFLTSRDAGEQAAGEDGGEEEHDEEEDNDENALARLAQKKERAAHMAFRHPLSDALSALRAAGAYAFARASSAFCREHLLHEKTMQHALQLRRQLTRIVGGDEAADLAAPPPSRAQEALLRQIVAAGLLDHVARRVQTPVEGATNRFLAECAYEVCSPGVSEPVYIHRASHVFAHDPALLPEFVVYQELLRTATRLTMTGVTVVEPRWLARLAQGTPLCSFSPPLEVPAPSFDAARDEVRCHVTCLYGTRRWALHAVDAPHPPGDARHRQFARLLLQGKVEPALAPLAGLLSSNARALSRGALNAPAAALVAELARAKVDSRASLAAARAANRKFAWAQVKKMYRKDSVERVRSVWLSLSP